MARTFVIGLLAIWAVQLGACLMVVVRALVRGELRLRSMPARVAVHEAPAPTELRVNDRGASAFAPSHDQERLGSDERPAERPQTQREDSDHVRAS